MPIHIKQVMSVVRARYDKKVSGVAQLAVWLFLRLEVRGWSLVMANFFHNIYLLLSVLKRRKYRKRGRETPIFYFLSTISQQLFISWFISRMMLMSSVVLLYYLY